MKRLEKLKFCPSCRRDKPLSFFSRGQNKDGFASYCKPCSRTAQKRSEAKLKTAGLESHTQRNHRRLRLEVLSYYGGSPPRCACCGETQYEFLSIDHENGGGGKHRRETKGSIYRWLKRNGFPSGYRVLCHCCNQSIGAYGRCPHQDSDKHRYFAESVKDVVVIRSDILAAAWTLADAGVYPSLAAIERIVKAGNLAAHRAELTRRGLWPRLVRSEFAPAKRGITMAAVEKAARAMANAGVYPTLDAVAATVGVSQRAVAIHREKLARSGRWPVPILGIGKRSSSLGMSTPSEMSAPAELVNQKKARP